MSHTIWTTLWDYWRRRKKGKCLFLKVREKEREAVKCKKQTCWKQFTEKFENDFDFKEEDGKVS